MPGSRYLSRLKKGASNRPFLFFGTYSGHFAAVIPRLDYLSDSDSGGHDQRAHRKLSLDALADLLASRRAAGCGEVKAIEVHHFGPGRNEVLDEFLVRVRASVHFRQSPKLCV